MTLEVLRMPYQQKALHCYLMLSIWILLLIAGIYKFLDLKPNKLYEQQSGNSILNFNTIDNNINNGDLFENLQIDVKTKKIFQLCNLPEEIVNGDEGKMNLINY